MCGISACSSASKFSPDKLRILMMYNESRGIQSCGLYNEGYGLIKVVGKVSEKLIPAVKIHPTKLAIAHMRFATKGEVTKDNSHPFEFGKVIGVHNGIISNWEAIAEHYDIKPEDIVVDSQILFKLISEQQDIKILKQFAGSAAIVYTKSDGTLYCYRNDDRPLWRGKHGDTLYISSIEESLRAIDCTSIKEFTNEYFYEIKNGKISNQFPYKRKDDDIIKSKIVVNTNFGYGSEYRRNNYTDTYRNSEWDMDTRRYISKEEAEIKRVARESRLRQTNQLALGPAAGNSKFNDYLNEIEDVNSDGESPIDSTSYKGVLIPMMNSAASKTVEQYNSSLNSGSEEVDPRKLYENSLGYWDSIDSRWIFKESINSSVEEVQKEESNPFQVSKSDASSSQFGNDYSEEEDLEVVDLLTLGKVLSFMNNVCIKLENIQEELNTHRGGSETVRARISADLESIRDSIMNEIIVVWAEKKDNVNA